MPAALPPQPRYPVALDDDASLFHVYNTAEAPISSDNAAWADEIQIAPSVATLWADNGFASIDGELFYYGETSRNNANQITSLRRCLRNLGGRKTHLNPAGSIVRGMVVAEHHNQLAAALAAVERFVGNDDTEDMSTIEWRLRQLELEADCLDDHDCPTVKVDFQFDDDDEDCAGTLATYNVSIDGRFERSVVDFGDGNQTDTQSGTHTYAPGARIDPVVTVSNGKCQIVQTPSTRENPEEPAEEDEDTGFEIPIPGIPNIPDVLIPPLEPPNGDFQFPQINFPCLSAGGSVNIPDKITIEPPIPTAIDFGPIDIPDSIDVNVPTIPPISVNVPTIPPVTFTPPTIPPITFASPPTIPVSFGTAPTVNVNWGTPPQLTGTVTVTCGSPGSQSIQGSRRFSKRPPSQSEEDFDALIASTIESLEAEQAASGVSLMATPQVQLQGMPESIALDTSAVPASIALELTTPLPSRIELVPVGLPQSIALDASSLDSKTIRLDASELPETIRLDASAVPTSIAIDASSIPREIRLVGAPEFIELRGDIPKEIQIVAPKDLEVPLVFRGGYVPLRFDQEGLGQIVSTLAEQFGRPN